MSGTGGPGGVLGVSPISGDPALAEAVRDSLPAMRNPGVVSAHEIQDGHKLGGVRKLTSGDRVIAVSEQIAELVNDRYGTPWTSIAVIPASVDFERFDPAAPCPADGA